MSRAAAGSVTGVELARGIGHRPAKGFWAEAFGRVALRPRALFGLVWVAVVLLAAVAAPFVANGHPLVMAPAEEAGEGGVVSGFVSAAAGQAGGFAGAWLLVSGVLWGAAWAAGPGRLRGAAALWVGLGVFAVFALRVFSGFFVGVAEGDPVADAVRPITALVVTETEAGARPTAGYQVLLDLAAAGGLWWAAGVFGVPRAFRAATCWLFPVAAAVGLGSLTLDRTAFESPLLEHLTPIDLVLAAAALAAPIVALPPAGGVPRARRLWLVVVAASQAGVTVTAMRGVAAWFGRRDVSEWVRAADQGSWLAPAAALVVPAAVGACFWLLGPGKTPRGRLLVVALGAVAGSQIGLARWAPPLATFEYLQRQASGEVEAAYTLVPFSPTQQDAARDNAPPGTTLAWASSPRPVRLALEGREREVPAAEAGGAAPWAERVPGSMAGRRFLLGTDGSGRDVLSQLVHAARLSVSIGVISTGIAAVIGVTLGALMGYFRGVVELVLYRLVEVFMSIPQLVLLILAAGVLPPDLRSTYVMMAIIGLVAWTGIARFTRAEFLKLRDQDFVQAARAAGLPLRSVLFKHMLPNGVTPVLVDASFQIAAAILIEAILSFLGLGPQGQPSWGLLLRGASGGTGEFYPWLAVYPGLAIFLTVLSYNLIGEALRDAIDPKLQKARV